MLSNPKMYFCPSDDTNSALFQLRPQQISSYVINGAVCGYSRALNPPVKLSHLYPSGISFWECNNATTNDNRTLFNDGASYPNENTSGRHGNVTPVGMFDGSARMMQLTEWTGNVNTNTRMNCGAIPTARTGCSKRSARTGLALTVKLAGWMKILQSKFNRSQWPDLIHQINVRVVFSLN